MVIPGLLMIVLGSVLSWASSLALYAFGEMADDVAAIKKRMILDVLRTSTGQPYVRMPACTSR